MRPLRKPKEVEWCNHAARHVQDRTVHEPHLVVRLLDLNLNDLPWNSCRLAE